MLFTPITTQEDFDAAVRSAIEENTRELEKKYEGYMSPDDVSALNKKIAAHEKSISELTAKNQKYERNSMRTRIAHEKGIPYELADRLAGDTEDDMRADAEKLSAFIAKEQDKREPLPAPKYSGESHAENVMEAGLSAMLSDLSN